MAAEINRIAVEEHFELVKEMTEERNSKLFPDKLFNMEKIGLLMNNFPEKNQRMDM
jgi:hypothetical protein